MKLSENISIFLGDCLELMNDIPDGSVDLVLCDPPYGSTGSEWDKIISPDKLWEQYRRVISETGVICLFGTEPFATHMRAAALDLYKYDWIWRKNTVTGFAHAANMPLRDYENIMVFSKGIIRHDLPVSARKRMTYNPQGLKDCAQKDKAHKASKIMHHGTFQNTPDEYYMREKTGFPRMVLDFDKKPKDSAYHINGKPPALLEYLVRTYTATGGIVLDNTMGGGSAGLACIRANRKFIGIEKCPEIFKKAYFRLEDELSQFRFEV